MMMAVLAILGVLAFRITSPDIDVDHDIASPYTCDGGDSAPAIGWEDLPDGTRALALVVEDAPGPPRRRVHWVLYNMPATSTGLPEHERARTLLEGTRVGLNSWGRAAYTGPCPPIGVRGRYVFELYALDAPLPDLGPSATAVTVVNAMRGHVLARTDLVAGYRRSR